MRARGIANEARHRTAIRAAGAASGDQVGQARLLHGHRRRRQCDGVGRRARPDPGRRQECGRREFRQSRRRDPDGQHASGPGGVQHPSSRRPYRQQCALHRCGRAGDRHRRAGRPGRARRAAGERRRRPRRSRPVSGSARISRWCSAAGRVDAHHYVAGPHRWRRGDLLPARAPRRRRRHAGRGDPELRLSPAARISAAGSRASTRC